ncbi:hypothetical protein EC973_007219 [Apophysomyces ossiformis]|uniref:F-box domain-containing protein n=1 Tax=Apophysomyces ossiformis TaxID=679940 RepID=A0A8H7BMM4_9FUNG|nr:hypothetical protein EC973_007219 [Apophysomyces ossiformis]
MRFFWVVDPSTEHPSSVAKGEINFPAELVNLIVQYVPRSSLPALALTCKMWYHIVMPFLYRHLHICTRHHWHCLIRSLRTKESLGSYVESLVLRKSPRLVPARLTSALIQSTKEETDETTIGYVRLERVDLDHTGLERIEEPAWTSRPRNENYAELDTTEKEAEWLGKVSIEEIREVLEKCTRLRYLDVSGCENLGDLTLPLASRARIEGLWLALVRGLTPQGMQLLIEAEMRKPGPSALRHLDLSFCRHLNDTILASAMQCWGQSLTHLRLNSLYDITDAGVLSIAQHCPNLRLLHLTRCWQLTNTSLDYLSQQCPKLVYVSVAFLSRSNEQGIGQFVHRCPQLRWLDITGCGINSLFKPMIIRTWFQERQTKSWGEVHFQDGAMHLL